MTSTSINFFFLKKYFPPNMYKLKTKSIKKYKLIIIAKIFQIASLVGLYVCEISSSAHANKSKLKLTTAAVKPL